MAVYVDDMRARFGRMVMCHMLADTTEELLAMADKIAVARRWIQHPGTHREHFDICLSKRAVAVQHGAVEISWRDVGELLSKRREAATKAATTPERRCACLADDSMECAAIRYGMDHWGEACECSCHAQRDDDDDY